MPLYFVELGDLPVELPATPEPGLPAQLRETLGLGLRAFPRVLGAGRRRSTPRERDSADA
jgi:hypothetical protein